MKLAFTQSPWFRIQLYPRFNCLYWLYLGKWLWQWEWRQSTVVIYKEWGQDIIRSSEPWKGCLPGQFCPSATTIQATSGYSESVVAFDILKKASSSRQCELLKCYMRWGPCNWRGVALQDAFRIIKLDKPRQTSTCLASLSITKLHIGKEKPFLAKELFLREET